MDSSAFRLALESAMLWASGMARVYLRAATLTNESWERLENAVKKPPARALSWQQSRLCNELCNDLTELPVFPGASTMLVVAMSVAT